MLLLLIWVPHFEITGLNKQTTHSFVPRLLHPLPPLIPLFVFSAFSSSPSLLFFPSTKA